MKKPKAPLNLLIPAISILMIGVFAASSNLDIEYSHNVVGSGTVMTDYKMGSQENTLATGKVRVTGEVLNKYIFQSNNSNNVTIEDQFIFSKDVEANDVAIRDYPMTTNSPGRFRMLGTPWAENIDISQPTDALNESIL